MRLLELRTEGASEPGLEFHPNLTVVSGLDDEARQAVRAAVAALPAGDTPGLAGLVEAHGILFDLTVDTLAVLGLDQPLAVVVESADLAEATSGPSPEATSPSSARAVTDPVPDASAIAELERVELAVADAQEAFSVTDEALERARIERAAAVEATGRIQAALDKARVARDQARSQRDGKVDTALASGTGEERARQHVDDLSRTVADLEEAIAELEERDPRPVQVLVDALRQPVSDRLVPSQEAIAVADEFAELQVQLDEAERRLQADGMSMDQLSQRLEDCRTELRQAEKGVKKPELTPEDVTELEAAHDEVLDAERRASGRMGRKAALKQLDEARELEQAILDRVGFPTWTSYVMGSSLLNIDPMAEVRLETARAELAEAEAAWADLTGQLEADPDYSGLLDRLEAVFLAAFDILGGETEGDLEGLLRSHLVPDEEVSRDDILEALAYQLGLRGVEIEEGAGGDTVAGIAEEWLAATGDHWEKYRALQEEHQRVRADLDAAEAELEVVLGQAEADNPEGRQEAYELAEAKVAEILADLEQANEIVADLEGQVDARELMLMPARLALDAAVAARDAAQAALDAPGSPVGQESPGAGAHAAAYVQPSYDRKPEVYDDLPYASDDDDDDEEVMPGDWGGSDDIEFWLLSRMAALRHVSHGGSVPLVLDDALCGLDEVGLLAVMAKLERMAEAVQVIYLSDDPALVDWAERAGLQRAAAVSCSGDLRSSLVA